MLVCNLWHQFVCLFKKHSKPGRVIEEANQNEADKRHVTVVDELAANGKKVFELINKQIGES